MDRERSLVEHAPLPGKESSTSTLHEPQCVGVLARSTSTPRRRAARGRAGTPRRSVEELHSVDRSANPLVRNVHGAEERVRGRVRRALLVPLLRARHALRARIVRDLRRVRMGRRWPGRPRRSRPTWRSERSPEPCRRTCCLCERRRRPSAAPATHRSGIAEARRPRHAYELAPHEHAPLPVEPGLPALRQGPLPPLGRFKSRGRPELAGRNKAAAAVEPLSPAVRLTRPETQPRPRPFRDQAPHQLAAHTASLHVRPHEDHRDVPSIRIRITSTPVGSEGLGQQHSASVD